MMSLKLLFVLYVNCCLLWSLILLYYLNKALVAQRQPAWLKTVVSSGAAGEMVLYGSVIISPVFIFFLAWMGIKTAFKSLFGRRDK